jgi:hypothetical protein
MVALYPTRCTGPYFEQFLDPARSGLHSTGATDIRSATLPQAFGGGPHGAVYACSQGASTRPKPQAGGGGGGFIALRAIHHTAEIVLCARLTGGSFAGLLWRFHVQNRLLCHYALPTSMGCCYLARVGTPRSCMTVPLQNTHDIASIVVQGTL